MNGKALCAGFLISIVAAQTPPNRTYRDPNGKFTVTLPTGWTAREAEGGASIMRDDTYISVVPLDGPPPPGLLDTMTRQVGQQWQNFRQIDSGPWKLAGMPGQFGMYTGTNPKGSPALLRIVAAGVSGRGFLMIVSVPQNEWEPFKSDLQRIEESFSTGSSSGQDSSAVSAATAPSPPVRPAGLARPSASLRVHQGAGFDVSVPDNWTATSSRSGKTTYLAAPDGKWEIEGGMTVALGMIAGFEAATGRDLKTVTDRQVADLQASNPGLRVMVRQPAKLSGLTANSLLIEEPSPIQGERERTWLVLTLRGDQVFWVALISPARDFDELRGLFGRILESVRLR